MTKLNLRAVLGKQWDKFKADFIYKPLEERVRTSQGADQVKAVETLSKVNNFLEKYGSDALDFDCEIIRSKGSKHEVRGGWLGQVRVPITSDLEIVNFIKCFADRESYDKAVLNQAQVASGLKDTPLEGLVSQPVFTNSAEMILVTPFINGKLLHNSVRELGDKEKVDKLKKVIDDYFSWKGALQGKKLTVGTYGHPLAAMQKLLDCDEKDPFVQAMRPVCDELYNGPKTLIHGDYHLSNIIENGRFHPIDWESFSLGYEEADAGKMFAKAMLSQTQWGELMKYFAEKQKLVSFDKSIRRQWLNRIRQEVFSVGRYVARSNETPELRPQAAFAYNKLLRTVQKATKRGYVDVSLENAAKAYFEKLGLETFSDEEFEKQHDDDPDVRQSFENGTDQESLEERAVASDINAEKEIKRLHRNLYSWPWKKIRNMAAAAVVGIAAVAGIATSASIGFDKYSKLAEENEKQKRERNEELKISQYHSMFREPFRKAIEVINTQKRFNYETMEKVAKNSPYTTTPKDVLPLKDPLIDKLASKYNFDPKFIRHMLDINRFYALETSERENPAYDDINYFEPSGLVDGRFGRIISEADPRKNLEMGLELLADFRDQFRKSYKINSPNLKGVFESMKYTYAFPDGLSDLSEKLKNNDTEALLDALALQDALLAFYSRYEDQNEGRDNFEMGRVLAWAVLRGLEGDEAGNHMPNPSWSISKDFNFTDCSVITKYLISSIGYHDLKQLVEHRRVYEEKNRRWSNNN